VPPPGLLAAPKAGFASGDAMNVNWELWADLPTVQLWEAVSLSLEIEPKRLLGYDHASTRDPIFRFPFAACSTEFKRRLEIATQHLGRSLLVDLLLEPAWESQVKLQDVSQWTGSLNSPWTFPEKFPKINVDVAAGTVVPTGHDTNKITDIVLPDYSANADCDTVQNRFKYLVTKKEMIARHHRDWPTIARDIKDASTNGLATAKPSARKWDEELALGWARANNKLIDRSSGASNLQGTMANFGPNRNL